MTTRSILVHLPGFPLEPAHLMPQRDLARAASALLADGHWTRILDYGTLSSIETFSIQNARRSRKEDRTAHLLAAIAALPPLDFTVLYVRTRSDFGEALHVGRKLRAHKRVSRLFLAGPFVTGFGGLSLLAAEDFDGVIKGDPAGVFPFLASRITEPAEWSAVPFLVYREDGRIRTTQQRSPCDGWMPGPIYDSAVYPALSREEKILLFPVGPFPYASGVSGFGGWHTRQPGAGVACRAREEMEAVAKAWGGAAFHISGLSPGVSCQENMARELLEHGCHFPFSARACPGSEALHAYPMLRRAGCEALHFEVYTGSQRLQDDFYGSGHGMSRIEAHVGACRGAGIPAHAGLTYPCPHDDYHTLEETLRFLRRCRPETASLELPGLSEGGRWWQHPGAYGFRVSQRSVLRWLKAAACRSRGGTMTSELPYRMRGWTVGRIMEARERLGEQMQQLGVARCGTVYTAMMAKLSGYGGDEGAYDFMLSSLLARGDVRGLRSLVDEFNASVMWPVRRLGRLAYTPALEAVGN